MTAYRVASCSNVFVFAFDTTNCTLAQKSMLLAVKGAKSMPTMRSASFGWNEFHTPATPWEVWIDDIAMDSKRIGCAR